MALYFIDDYRHAPLDAAYFQPQDALLFAEEGLYYIARDDFQAQAALYYFDPQNLLEKMMIIAEAQAIDSTDAMLRCIENYQPFVYWRP